MHRWSVLKSGVELNQWSNKTSLPKHCFYTVDIKQQSTFQYQAALTLLPQCLQSKIYLQDILQVRATMPQWHHSSTLELRIENVLWIYHAVHCTDYTWCVHIHNSDFTLRQWFPNFIEWRGEVSEDFIVPSSLTLCMCTNNNFISFHVQNQHFYIFVNE
jgi:hypothetical protein